MSKLRENLKRETEKWLEKIKREINEVEADKAKGKEFLKNIHAYISDSQHFLESGNLIESFEAIIWAYAYLEIGKEIGLINKKEI